MSIKLHQIYFNLLLVCRLDFSYIGTQSVHFVEQDRNLTNGGSNGCGTHAATSTSSTKSPTWSTSTCPRRNSGRCIDRPAESCRDLGVVARALCVSLDDALPKRDAECSHVGPSQWPSSNGFDDDQRMVRDTGFIFRAKHPDGSAVTTGLDPVIGQNAPVTAHVGMDEPAPNYPTGNVRSTLNQPNAFVAPTARASFFVPSISVLQHEISS
jgi:hypothetical protein